MAVPYCTRDDVGMELDKDGSDDVTKIYICPECGDGRIGTVMTVEVEE